MAYGTVNADVIGTSVAGSNLGAGNASIMKNRIINGAMVIDQRNAGASITPTNNQYSVDRWQFQGSQASKLTMQQNAGSVTPPVGFTNYLGVTSSSAYSVTSTDYFLVRQAIEGYNMADLGWGTANAKTVTLSFQVYSSLTGTFGGSLSNNGDARCYPFTYSIPVANTWTTISVTIAGDTSGTWQKTTSTGINIYFSMGTGSTYLGTAGTWAGTSYYGATGQTNLVGTNGATWYATGIQLEVGSSATGYEYRQYGQELALCQRYFEKSWDIGTAVGTATATGLKYSSASFAALTTSYLADGLIYQVPKRATPTVTIYDVSGNSGKCNRESWGVSQTNNSAVTTPAIGTNNVLLYSSGTANSQGISYHYTIVSEL